MKKTFMLFNILIVSLSLIACNENQMEEESQFMSYEKMYQSKRETSYNQMDPDYRHVAEHGFYKKLEQGYNEWFYVTGADELLTLSDEKWIYNNSYIENEYMHSQIDMIARKFIVKHEGEARLTGFIKPIDDVQLDIYFSIRLNDEIILKTTKLSSGQVDGLSYDFSQFLSIGDTLFFTIESEKGTVSWNPAIAFNKSENDTLHYVLPDGKYLGDVHPFYDEDNNKMYMYYLDTNGRYDSRLLTSDNMINYNVQPIYTDSINPPEQNNYFVLGVFKQKDKYRTYFGLGDGFGSAESNDLITWKNSSIFNSELKMERKAYFDYDQFPGGGRDPFAFFDADINRYRIIGMAYKSHPDNRSIIVYTSDDADGKYFTQPPVELINYPNQVDGDPECTMVVKINKRWYIFTSRYGKSVHGVGRLSYFMGGEDIPFDKVDWENTEERYLDGEDLAAAQIVDVGGHYYVYGWIPQTWNQNQWGGILNIAREVVQRDDGLLGTKIDPYLTKLLKRGVDYNFTYLNETNDFTANNHTYHAESSNAKLLFNDVFNRVFIQTKLTAPVNDGSAGILIQQNNKIYEAKITRKRGDLTLSFGELGSNHNPSASLALEPNLNVFDIKLIIEGSNAIFSINDFYTLTVRSSILIDTPIKIGLFSTIKDVVFDDFKVHRLATLDNIFE